MYPCPSVGVKDCTEVKDTKARPLTTAVCMRGLPRACEPGYKGHFQPLLPSREGYRCSQAQEALSWTQHRSSSCGQQSRPAWPLWSSTCSLLGPFLSSLFAGILCLGLLSMGRGVLQTHPQQLSRDPHLLLLGFNQG